MQGAIRPVRKRLILVADNLAGGLGAAVTQEAKFFATRSWDVCVIAPDADESHASFASLSMLGVEFLAIQLPGAVRSVAKGVEAGYAVRGVAAAGRHPTVFHCHGLRSSAFVRLANWRTPFVMTYHGGTVDRGLRRLVMSLQARSSDWAISASPEPPRGFTFLPHASPIIDGIPAPPRLLSKDSELRLGWFGRLEPPKRPDLWLRSLKDARDLGIAVTGHVVGDGSLMLDLQRQARKLGTPLTFYGALPPNEAFKHMDVMLAWSDSDALAFTIQEAVWHGIPALTNDIPGPATLLRDAHVGVVAADSFPAVIASLSDPAAYQNTVLGQQSRLLEVLGPGEPLPRVYRAIEGLLPAS